MSDKITQTIIREEIFDVKGTTTMIVGDHALIAKLKDNTLTKPEKALVFNGNISSAELGKMRIRQVKETLGDGLDWETIEVDVVQSAYKDSLDIYLDDKYYTKQVKQHVDLDCESEKFDIYTKFSFTKDSKSGKKYLVPISFDTGANGIFGYMAQYKQYHGMHLSFGLDTSVASFDEVKEKMLKLFPQRKTAR